MSLYKHLNIQVHYWKVYVKEWPRLHGLGQVQRLEEGDTYSEWEADVAAEGIQQPIIEAAVA
jgi:hypothetical protein